MLSDIENGEASMSQKVWIQFHFQICLHPLYLDRVTTNFVPLKMAQNKQNATDLCFDAIVVICMLFESRVQAKLALK